MLGISSVIKAVIWLMVVGFIIALAMGIYTPTIESLAYFNLAIILMLLGMRSR